MANASRRDFTELYNTLVLMGTRIRRIAVIASVDVNFVVVLSLHFSSFAFNSLCLYTSVESLTGLFVE